MAAPWGFSVPASEAASFTIVRSGSALLELEGRGKSLHLVAGDAVVFPQGSAHAYRDHPASPAPPLFELLKRHPPRASAEDPALQAHLDAIEAEVKRGRLGSGAVMTRATETLFIHAMRSHLARAQPDGARWLGALCDFRIGRALARIHHAPQQEWTVGTLASLVGMSRSAFAHEFSRLVGEAPIQYITRLRIDRAAALLDLGNGKLADIGQAVGYKSEAAFRRSFKRILGTSPGTCRRLADDHYKFKEEG